jgi:hypothetical protein
MCKHRMESLHTLAMVCAQRFLMSAKPELEVSVSEGQFDANLLSDCVETSAVSPSSHEPVVLQGPGTCGE